MGKYHKIILNEGKLQGNELVTESVLHEHKTKLYKNLMDKNVEGITEVLLSLRVNALQIAPELRKNLVYELIRNDLFNYENNEYKLLIDLLSIQNDKLQTALISIISVVASTLKGVDYLTQDSEKQILRILLKVPLLNYKTNISYRG